MHISTSLLISTQFLPNTKSKKEGKDQESIHQAPHLTQDTNGKVTTSQLDITNKGQEVSLFQAGDNKASINRCTRNHNKNKTEVT